MYSSRGGDKIEISLGKLATRLLLRSAVRSSQLTSLSNEWPAMETTLLQVPKSGLSDCDIFERNTSPGSSIAVRSVLISITFGTVGWCPGEKQEVGRSTMLSIVVDLPSPFFEHTRLDCSNKRVWWSTSINCRASSTSSAQSLSAYAGNSDETGDSRLAGRA